MKTKKTTRRHVLVFTAIILLLAFIPGPAWGRQAAPEGPQAATPSPAPEQAPGEPQAPPPTLVDKVIEQILVERDLEAARSLLVKALGPALGDAHNPGWVARIYALLAVIDIYQGEADRAERYLWRAVVLNPNIQIEPELGDVPLSRLEAVRARWRSLEQDATMTFSDLPAGLAVFVDGRRCDGTIALKPGEHLVQVCPCVRPRARTCYYMLPLLCVCVCVCTFDIKLFYVCRVIFQPKQPNSYKCVSCFGVMF